MNTRNGKELDPPRSFITFLLVLFFCAVGMTFASFAIWALVTDKTAFFAPHGIGLILIGLIYFGIGIWLFILSSQEKRDLQKSAKETDFETEKNLKQKKQ